MCSNLPLSTLPKLRKFHLYPLLPEGHRLLSPSSPHVLHRASIHMCLALPSAMASRQSDPRSNPTMPLFTVPAELCRCCYTLGTWVTHASDRGWMLVGFREGTTSAACMGKLLTAASVDLVVAAIFIRHCYQPGEAQLVLGRCVAPWARVYPTKRLDKRCLDS